MRMNPLSATRFEILIVNQMREWTIDAQLELLAK